MKVRITESQLERLKDNLITTESELDEEKPPKDDTAKFIKCRNCKKLFTQTIHKKKKSLPICPWCGTHN